MAFEGGLLESISWQMAGDIIYEDSYMWNPVRDIGSWEQSLLDE